MRYPFVCLRVFVACFLVLIVADLSAQRLRSLFHKSKVSHVYMYDEDEPAGDSLRGFSYGLNLGGYFASAKTANFYNGTCPIEGFVNEAAQIRCFTIVDRLDRNVFIQDGSYITNFYNATDYVFPYDTYPTNMKYNPAMYVGLQLKYNFSRYSAVFLNVNALKLNAAGQFSMRFLGTPQPLNAQGDIRLFAITGSEQRMNLNLGFRQGWMMGDFSNFYLQFGGSMLATKWTKNQIYVAERSFDLMTNVPFAGQTAVTAQAQAGLGFGGFAGTGVEFWLGKYSFDVGFVLSRDKVKIFSYSKNVWNKMIQMTFMLS